MVEVTIRLSEASAARLAAAAEAADVPAEAFAGALLADALEGGPLTPRDDSRGVAAGRRPLEERGAMEAPDEGTVAALALAFHRGDLEGARVILEGTSLPLLIACAMAWWNGIGITEHGAEGWEARLQEFLTEAARRGLAP